MGIRSSPRTLLASALIACISARQDSAATDAGGAGDARGPAAARPAAPSDGGGTRSGPDALEEKAPSGLSLHVWPRSAHTGSLVTLRVSSSPPLSGKDRIRWRTTGGYFLYDDLPRVHWRAPEKPGRHTLTVTVSGRTARETRITLEASRPSTRGMVWIPPGEFLLGDVEGTRNVRDVKTVQHANDEPFHVVDLDGYWIDRVPVTNREYVSFLEKAVAQGMAQPEEIAVMGEFRGSRVPFYYLQPYERLILDYYATRPANVPRFVHAISWDGERFHIKRGHEEHPVVDITWFGAAAYANFHGKELPSEAQWEKAARGTDGRRYPWGDNLPTRYHVNLDLELTPVGSYSPRGDSPYGVADMLSPCFEWTNDWFNGHYYSDFLAATPHRNPRGTFWGDTRAIRGFPAVIQMRYPSVDRGQPLTRRYHWIFEFMLGDSFGNAESAFRTVLAADRDEKRGAGRGAPRPENAPGDRDGKGSGSRGVAVTLPQREPVSTAALDSGGSSVPQAGETEFDSSDFAESESCRRCHPRQYLEWRGSAHAYAFVDPVFQALHRKAVRETDGEVGTLCLDCHSPIGVRSGELRPGFRKEELSTQVREGVSCLTCHRAEPHAAAEDVANASFALEPGEVVFGGLHRPRETTAHASADSSFLRASESCGACHEVVHGSRRIEKTFLEWSESEHRERGTSCQDCHMLRYSGRAARGGPFRDDLRRHGFPGVSIPLIPFPNQGYQREEVEEFLRRSARLSVETPRAAEAGSPLELTVRVKNSGAGHNLPAGSMRRMWLEVTALDAGGGTIFRSGHLDAGGDLLDRHSRLEPGGDPQLVEFSDSHVDAAGREVPYWRATRLEERSLGPLEVRVVRYRIPVPASLEGSRLRLRVRLLLRSLSPRSLRSLGLEELVPRLPIWEMNRWEADALPVARQAPRRTRYRVPDHFAGLQEAVDALRDGDRVIVDPGEYLLDAPLDYRGKEIDITSREGPGKTILRLTDDAPAERRSVVVFRSGEGTGARLEGFTVTGGEGTMLGGRRAGGGILIVDSSPTVKGNRVVENTARGGLGGGICAQGGRPGIVANEVAGCRADLGGGLTYRGIDGSIVLARNSLEGNVGRKGGGIYLEGAGRVMIERSVVAGNVATREGPAIFAGDGLTLEIDRGTFVLNRMVGAAAVIRAEASRPHAVTSSIFWKNRPRAFDASFSYCILDRQLADPGTNLRREPLFLSPGALVERAASRAPPVQEGDDDPARSGVTSTGWIIGDYRLLPASPAIDAGDPRAVADPDDSPRDIGALFLEQPLKGFVRGDVDGNGRVRLDDLLALARALGGDNAPRCLDAADVDDGGRVSPADAALLAAFLFAGARPPAPFPRCGLDPTFGEGLSCAHEPSACGDEVVATRP